MIGGKTHTTDVHRDSGLARSNITNGRPLLSRLTTPTLLWLSDWPNTMSTKIGQFNQPREVDIVEYRCSHKSASNTADQRIDIENEQAVSHLAAIGKDSEILGTAAE